MCKLGATLHSYTKKRSDEKRRSAVFVLFIAFVLKSIYFKVCANNYRRAIENRMFGGKKERETGKEKESIGNRKIKTTTTATRLN